MEEMQQQVDSMLRQIDEVRQSEEAPDHLSGRSHPRGENSGLGVSMNAHEMANIVEWIEHAGGTDDIASEGSDAMPYTEISSVISTPKPSESYSVGSQRLSASTARGLDVLLQQHDTVENGESSGTEDDFFLDAARDAITTGRDAFDQRNYAEATATLEEALALVGELAPKTQTACDLWDLRFMLSVCAFNLQGPAEAESALWRFLDNVPWAEVKENKQRLQLYSASHLLSLISVKLGKIDQARQYCINALQGRRKLLGKSHEEYFESLALLIRIESLDGKDQRSKVYFNLIPPELQDNLMNRFSSLKILSSTKITAKRVSIGHAVSTENSITVDSSSNMAPTPEPERLEQPVSYAFQQLVPTVGPSISKAADPIIPSIPSRSGQRRTLGSPPVLGRPDRTEEPVKVLPAQVHSSVQFKASAMSMQGRQEDDTLFRGPKNTVEYKEPSLSGAPARHARSVRPPFVQPVRKIDPEKVPEVRFVSIGDKYKTEPLRKLLASGGYVPPGPADAKLRSVWVSWFEIHADTELKAALIAGNSSAAVRLAREHGNKGNIWNDAKPKPKSSDLHYAALFGELEVVQKLLVRHAKASSFKNNRGELAIEFASIGGYKDIVEVLSDAGSPLGLALPYATLLQRLDVVNTILALGAPPKPTWASHAACVANNTLLLRAVCVYGSGLGQYALLKPDELSALRETSMRKAPYSARTKYVAAPRMNDIDDEVVKTINVQPFGIAAYCGSVACIQYLMDEGVSTSALYETTGSRGSKISYTALDLASMKGRVDVVRYLIDRGIAHTSPSKGTRSDCLYVAVVNNQRACEDLLLESGALVNERTWLFAARAKDTDYARMAKFNSSSLSTAARAEALRCLVAANELCNVHNPRVAKYAAQILEGHNAPTACQFTFSIGGHSAKGSLVHVAVLEKNLCAVGWLLKQQMAVDAQDSEGRTPLYLATLLKEYNIAELLLQYHASKTKQSKAGRTPFDLVRESTSISWRILFEDSSSLLTNTPKHIHACAKMPAVPSNRLATRQVIVELRGDGIAELQGYGSAELEGRGRAELQEQGAVELPEEQRAELRAQRMVELHAG